MFKEIEEASDRAAAILAASFVQSVLRLKIIEHLHHRDDETVAALMQRDGALSSFFSSIHLAYAMGAISKTEVDDLGIVRRVRNAFAHSIQRMDFDQAEVAAEIAKLSLHRLPDQAAVWGAVTNVFPGWGKARQAYVATCNMISIRMLADSLRRKNAIIRDLQKQIDGLKRAQSEADNIDK